MFDRVLNARLDVSILFTTRQTKNEERDVQNDHRKYSDDLIEVK